MSQEKLKTRNNTTHRDTALRDLARYVNKNIMIKCVSLGKNNNNSVDFSEKATASDIDDFKKLQKQINKLLDSEK